MNGLIIDNFAGGGGASTGIEQALGRPVDIAINHDPEAISMHKANHPNTKHYCENVWDVDPLEATKGKPVFLAWFSPDCKHFSKAKGGKPVEKKIRGLAWLAVKWAKLVKPQIIMLENVEEFKTWGPLGDDSKPDPERKGHTFRSWVKQLKELGYDVEYRELKASDYGAPTIRRRLFVVARCDGIPVHWPFATHGEGLKPYRPAADIIDWSLPCPSIFTRKRPLAENTLKRIAKGLKKFVIDDPEPFIIGCGGPKYSAKPKPISKPLNTLCTTNHSALITPYITRIGHTGWNGCNMNYSLDEPLTTVTSKAEHCLVMPFIAKNYTGVTGQHINKPLSTVTSIDHHSLVCTFLQQYYTSKNDKECRCSGLKSPLPVIPTENRHSLVSTHLLKLSNRVDTGSANIEEVHAFLLKYYGNNIGQDCREPLQTITSKHRFGLVTIHGQDYQIVDIGMRMLQPHELYAGQGFPDDYIISHDSEGNKITKTAQVRMCGNSVSPHAAKALVEANVKAIAGGVAA
jgi:DNA (cytosine-5)-methyltransferase 1